MKTCVDIYKKNKGETYFGKTIYIDPLGFEYPKSVVVCSDCIFNLGYDSCVLFKEVGFDEDEIKKKVLYANSEHECKYFLINNFSEDDDEDIIAKNAVHEISKRLNYPEEYWRRHNIHIKMYEKGIGYMIYENQSCETCEFCQAKALVIQYCKYHKIELFANERYCKYYKGEKGNDESNRVILTTAELYRKGINIIPISDEYSLRACPGHTFSIIRQIDLKEIYILEPYLLDSVRYSNEDRCIYAKYVHKVEKIDIKNKLSIE